MEAKGDRGTGVWENRGWKGFRRPEKEGWEVGSLRVREAGEKFKKASVRYLFLLVKNTNPATFFDFHLTFSEASNKILYARKCKFVLGLKTRISFGKIGNLFKSFTSLGP